MINDRLIILISYRSGTGVTWITLIDGRCCQSVLPNPQSQIIWSYGFQLRGRGNIETCKQKVYPASCYAFS